MLWLLSALSALTLAGCSDRTPTAAQTAKPALTVTTVAPRWE